ncbi:hypothetical protein J6590_008562, partial [Homalodisca vitripennis]
ILNGPAPNYRGTLPRKGHHSPRGPQLDFWQGWQQPVPTFPALLLYVFQSRMSRSLTMSFEYLGNELAIGSFAIALNIEAHFEVIL